MRDLKLGIVLPLYEDPDTGRVHRWDELRTMARLAEDIGFDTVWVPDELLWRVADWPGPDLHRRLSRPVPRAAARPGT